MKPVIDLLALHSYLKTSSDERDFIGICEKISDDLFKNDLQPAKIIAQDVPYELQKKITTMMQDHGVMVSDKPSVQHFVRALQEAIEDLPVAHLVLAIDPDQDTVERVSEWLCENIGELVLLDIKRDPLLIAGGVISFNGKTHDYSLMREIGREVCKVESL